MSNLKREYLEIIIPNLQEKFNYKNKHQIPKLEKIQISAGLGVEGLNKVNVEKCTNEFGVITGQMPVLTLAKKSVSGFKTRKGMPLGLVVTLRREKMYAFLEKFIKLVLPRIRDFRGLNPNSFDPYGNYSVGISDQLFFPEIDYDSVDKKRGFNITIVTTASTPEEGFYLLKQLGVPFSEKQ